MNKKLQLSKVTITNLEDITGGAPFFSKNPKKCETLVPLCIEDTIVDCNQSGTPCLP